MVMTSVDSRRRPEPGREPRAGEARVIRDEDARLWRVREVRFADAKPSLIFECEAGFRRVRTYPENWRSLSDEELQRLSWKT
jgi:hypothetical protein